MIAPNIDISEYTPSSGPTVVPPGGKGDSLSPNPSSIPQPVSIASKSGSKGQMGTGYPSTNVITNKILRARQQRWEYNH